MQIPGASAELRQVLRTGSLPLLHLAKPDWSYMQHCHRLLRPLSCLAMMS